MTVIRQSITLVLLLMCTAVWAQKTDGLIVTTTDAVQQFAIRDVKELTFSDAGLTVVKTDDASVEFPSGWQISFGEVEESGISFVEISGRDYEAQVFNTEGILVKVVSLSDLRLSELPKGVYVINCNGKSVKIKSLRQSKGRPVTNLWYALSAVTSSRSSTPTARIARRYCSTNPLYRPRGR